MNIPNVNYLLAELLWAQIHRAGVERVVVSPGSRSTPHARTAVLNSKFKTDVQIDERSAAFFALGLAKASAKPVALVCTSGTAAAHYYPAIIEAAQGGYPLVVVTADRPQRLRNSGAAQTIDQTALFGRYPKMSLDLPAASNDEVSLHETLNWIDRALTAMWTPPFGPIHINVPLDEPLAPVDIESNLCTAIYSQIAARIQTISPTATQSVVPPRKLITALENAYCGLIVCGPDAGRTVEERDAIHNLSRTLGWPLLADVASGLRFCGEPNLPMYDLFLRHDSLSRLAPDVVLEFGMVPTSKALNAYLNRHRARTFRIQRDTLPRDPDRRAVETYVTNVSEIVNSLVQSVKVSRDSLLLDAFWKAAGALRAALAGKALNLDSEMAYVNAALEYLPAHSNLVLASSMSIRYADMLAVPSGRHIQVYAQRSTNGIDGTLSHAAGVASGSGQPTYLICGDLAFLHDLSGLAAVRNTGSLRILLLNNNGGGIFHFLPIDEFQDTFEQIHGTPTNVDLGKLCAGYQVTFSRAESPKDVTSLLIEGKSQIVEVCADRARNRVAHERIVAELLSVLS